MMFDVIKHWIICVFLVNCYVGFQFMCYAVTLTVVPGVVWGAAYVVSGHCQSYIGVWWVHVLWLCLGAAECMWLSLLSWYLGYWKCAVVFVG